MKMDIRHEIKALATATLYGTYTVMLIIMLIASQNNWVVTLDFNRWNEGLIELMWFILMLP